MDFPTTGTRDCDHCGRVMGDLAGGSGSMSKDGRTYNLCHPNEPDRPDCYHLVTARFEPVGARRGLAVLIMSSGLVHTLNPEGEHFGAFHGTWAAVLPHVMKLPVTRWRAGVSGVGLVDVDERFPERVLAGDSVAAFTELGQPVDVPVDHELGMSGKPEPHVVRYLREAYGTVERR